jgi:Mrp family chromosome partitioning ATPase
MEDENKSQPVCESSKPGFGSVGGAASKIRDMMAENSLKKMKYKILVMSGKGGVGKSSIAANIAVGLSLKGFQTGLMDVDFHGPSIANIMGLKGLLDISEDKFASPKTFNENLKVVSMQSLLPEGDKAIIWRGPVKTGAIRQFLADVKWGALDFLVVDSPPGTGDEHLSVAHMIPDLKTVIVTTPQEVALADVRKSISFCRTTNIEILGLLENMGPFPCPCCGKTIDPFQSGGGEETARKTGVEFLGTLPFDPEVVKASDAGTPILDRGNESAFSKALMKSIDNMVAILKHPE